MMMKFFLGILIVLGMAPLAWGQHVCSSHKHECFRSLDSRPVVRQHKNGVKSIQVPAPVCEASNEVNRTYIPPPPGFLLKSAAATADIAVDYIDFPDAAREAVEYAVSIWESIIESDVPIRMQAKWSSTVGLNTLASCGPEVFYANFDKAPFPDVFYPVAIAEKITGNEMNGITRYDMLATFNSRINWYYGTDGKTPDTSYDLVSIALHEIAHGLGFTGFFFVNDNGLGDYGFYDFGDLSSFDLMVEQLSGKELSNTSFFDRASTELATALQSNSLYADSPVARSASGGNRPRLYAPSSFSDGSSIYHLNDATYPAGTTNSLMTHAAGRGEANHNPGPLAMGILEDAGWTSLILIHDPVKDKEQAGPLNFVATVESHYTIPKNGIKVIYSFDEFASHRDTLNMVSTGTENEFANGLTPGIGVNNIEYYVEVSDVKGRMRTSPVDAPKEVHKVHFGVDSEAPVIAHTGIDFFLDMGDPLELIAEVDDNLGLDTVFVEYSINGVGQTPFGLNLQKGTRYSGAFDFDAANLSDGDVVAYRIVARDASLAQNTTNYPVSGRLEFIVEKIFEPVSFYTNNFNNDSRDIFSEDFEVFRAINFNDKALHSPHPYPSPNQDNHEFNLTALLKRPIVVQEQGTMSFDEVVLVEPGETLAKYGDDDFWDYVIVEGSSDEGETWYALTDGYDAGANPTWDTNFNQSIVAQESQAEGTADWFVNREIGLTENGHFAAGDTIWIRFRLYSDPYANGWGWVIDNLRIQQPLSAGGTVLSPGNINVFPNPFQSHFRVDIEPSKQVAEVRVEIFDAYGRNLYSSVGENISGTLSEEIDMSAQPAGMYLLRVLEEGVPVLAKKLIKN